MKTLRAGVPAETRINIVVHSMGNRIVMESLSQLAEESGDEGRESRAQSGETSARFRSSQHGKPFANVVLCAPDVGRSDFLQWAPGVVALSERVTLYANASDDALIASQGLHAEQRAGDAGQPLVIDGIETIDCSRIDLSLMGHSYYGSNIDVLSDQFMLVKETSPPTNGLISPGRPPIAAKSIGSSIKPPRPCESPGTSTNEKSSRPAGRILSTSTERDSHSPVGQAVPDDHLLLNSNHRQAQPDLPGFWFLHPAKQAIFPQTQSCDRLE